MIYVSVAEAKAKMSELLKRAEAGEQVILTRHNRPVVELRAITTPKGKRPSGLCRGQFTVPPDFNTPLPDDLLDAFEGR